MHINNIKEMIYLNNNLISRHNIQKKTIMTLQIYYKINKNFLIKLMIHVNLVIKINNLKTLMILNQFGMIN